MSQRRDRRGTTLLELVVAVAIAGMVMLGGMLLLDQVNASDRRIDVESRRDAVEANGDRLLRRLVADARLAADTADRFRGDERNASYLASCDVPSGWSEPCRVLLSISASGGSSAVVVRSPASRPLELRRVAEQAVFRYLDPRPRADSSWLSTWTTSIALPAAIALVTPGDTVVLPMGSVRD